ncbi:protein ACCELERATED CELL DEATH 6-like [Castanea sativa]|uniref:protein ACCELERATED CELL DEATH 6-like n=1 Tax=Castanea sativa TaxID=21020 RepID=UPI003F64C0FF
MNPELYRAASSGDLSFFERLKNPETLVDVTIEKSTALHVAVQCNHFHVAQKMVQLRPNLLNQTNSKGDTPLHIAARVGSHSMVKLLVERIKSLDVEIGGQNILSMVNLVKDTALHIAVRYGKSGAVEELIKEDRELAMSINNAGESALFLAVDRKFYNIASQILSAAPEYSLAGRDGMNVLHAISLRSSHIEINGEDVLSSKGRGVRFLRSLLSLVNIYLPPAWVVLVGEVYPNRAQLRSETIPEDFVKEVMGKYPSAIEQGENLGCTPLHIAAGMGNVKLVKLFLENRTSLAYVKDKKGFSAFHIAAMEGNVLVMEELITACPDIYELLDNRGRTALHVAAENISLEAVNFFLKRPDLKGLINEQDEEGNTPMHLAAVNGRYKILSKLARCRDVDTNAVNKEGLTPMDKNCSSTNLRINLQIYTKNQLKAKGGLRSLRELLKMGTWLLNPEGQDKEQIQKETGIESADGGAGNATAIEKKVQQGQTAKENEVKNAASESKEEMAGISMSKSEILRSAGETNMLVATIIASVTFTAAFTAPGGYESGGINPGLAVLSKQAAFKAFVIANALAFGFSTASILVYMFSAKIRRVLSYKDRAVKTKRALELAGYSIEALLIAFISGTYAVVPHSLGIAEAIIICFCYFTGIRVFRR